MSFRTWLFETLGLGSGTPPRPTPSTHTASAPSLILSQRPAFSCPICASTCRTEQAPFSQYVTLHRCPQQHFVGVECASCKQGVMNHVGDLDFTVHTKCPSCGHQSSGIPKDWWYRNAAKRQPTQPSKPSSPLQDKRKELGECLDDMKGWGALTVDFIAAKLVSQDAARLAFHTLSSRASQNVGGRGVAVVYGILTLNAQALFVAGIICPVWETETNMRWFGDTSIEGLNGRPVKLGDQNREQFGWPTSPLTVYDFVVVQVSGA